MQKTAIKTYRLYKIYTIDSKTKRWYIVYIDASDLNDYSREQLEDMKMAIDIAKVIRDMQMDEQQFEMDKQQFEIDKQRYENERLQILAQIEKMKKETKHYPSIAVLTVMLSFAGAVIGSLIAAWI